MLARTPGVVSEAVGTHSLYCKGEPTAISEIPQLNVLVSQSHVSFRSLFARLGLVGGEPAAVARHDDLHAAVK